MAVNSTYTQSAGPNVPKPLQFSSGRVTFGADSITAADYIVQQLGFTPKMIRYFNRGYYNNRWSYSDAVTPAERVIAP